MKLKPKDYYKRLCASAIKEDNPETLREVFRENMYAKSLKYECMYDVCKKGGFKCYIYLVNNGIEPDITDAEWASRGRNENQRAIFEHIVENRPLLNFNQRDYLCLREACKRQSPTILAKLFDIALKTARSNRSQFESALKTCFHNAASFNNEANLSFLIERYFSIREKGVVSDLDESIAKFANTAALKGADKAAKIISDNFKVKGVTDAKKLIKKSQSDSFIEELFLSFPLDERHGLLTGMVDKGKNALAIRLSAPCFTTSTELDAEQCAAFIKPVVMAHSTDPFSFFNEYDIHIDWLPALPIILADAAS
tara:strand:+ start:1973 stop:2905 length:933 start_codon:yes stop_codon:yes gene_type:complete